MLRLSQGKFTGHLTPQNKAMEKKKFPKSEWRRICAFHGLTMRYAGKEKIIYIQYNNSGQRLFANNIKAQIESASDFKCELVQWRPLHTRISYSNF